MKFSEKWLREWANPDLDSKALCDQLSMAGLEVDDIEAAGPAFENVVVAEVQSVNPHPDADKLRVCLVTDGGAEPVQIVCGASNVVEGMKVPLARLGAVLPGGMKIRQAKLRGVESFGMLCSAVELGLADEADGLMPLPADAPPGKDIREYLSLDDHIIDIDLTPNRGDCLSISGVAREVAALNGIQVHVPEVAEIHASHQDRVELKIEDAKDCLRYSGLIIRDIDPNAATPVWMVERLRRGGIRNIHPVVDVTNYVMLELGQPMHAFDLGRLDGGIQVRRARQGEKLTPLVGEELELSHDDLVIADSSKPVALAGVMGGLETGVTENSCNILLESACFHPLAVAGTGRRHKLHTDSLHRFERGVDPKLQERALLRATGLILDICGGQAGEVFSEGAGGAQAGPILLRHARLEQLLGFEVPAEQVENILGSLGMKVEAISEQQWHVTAPSYRYDIAIEADLIEEVVRIYGYERLPDRPQQVALPAMHASESVLPVRRLRDALIHRGYQEAITYSFVDPERQSALIPDVEGISLDNPIARQYGQMRTSLWPGLLDAVHQNVQRQQSRVRLFEIGLRFELRNGEIIQQRMISGAVCGDCFPEQWSTASRPTDFYDVKGDVEALLDMRGAHDNIQFRAEEHTALHPGISAAILINGNIEGRLGALHPKLLKLYGLKTQVFLFELSLEALCSVQVPAHEEISEFPSTRRDLALLVPEALTAGQLLACVDSANEELLEKAFVFDVYRGEGLPSGCKSVALGLNFQDKSRTLTEQEVDAVVLRLQSRLSHELGVDIRG